MTWHEGHLSLIASNEYYYEIGFFGEEYLVIGFIKVTAAF
jgi:hypothetical protein